jgi:hypothetical protein
MPPRLLQLGPWGLSIAFLIAGCSGTIGDRLMPGGDNAGTGPGTGPGSGGPGTGPGTGAGGSGGGMTGGGTGGQPPMLCTDGMVHAGRAPLRRLTRFEYNNTVRDLFGDTTSPATAFPAEEIGNGFGNDADALSVSSFLAEQYGSVAEGVATRLTTNAAQFAKFAPCAATVTAATEDACTRTLITNVAGKAWRRTVTDAEIADLLKLEQSMRPLTGATFATSASAVIQAILLAPDFIYRIEWGVPDPANASLKRVSGDEMATRLSYFFWGTAPDDALRASAKTGELSTAQGVLGKATQMLDDVRSRPVVRFFFDDLLPINGLTDLERDKTLFPNYTPTIGSLMHEEVQQFLAFEIFDGPGTWTDAMTAPYTFVNGPLAAFYGMSGVSGNTFVKVPTDATKRIGFLTQAGVMAGTTHSNTTNPVTRGSFVVQKLMCNKISLPSGDILAMVKPPDPYSAPTARQRFTMHKTQPVCAGCHSQMDPVGFALENFDPMGTWRDKENGITIDASGSLPATGQMVSGPVDLVQKLAAADQTQFCFATHWMDFAYGRSTGVGDECATAAVEVAFQKSGYNVKQMLLALTQTDEFLYYPGSP